MPRHHKIRTWFDQRSLRAKLAGGFIALIALTLAVSAAALTSQRRALDAVQAFLEHDNRIAELTLRSNAELLQARRYEKDFQLQVRELGYAEARTRYVTLMQFRLAAVRQRMETVRRLTNNREMAQQALTVSQATTRYETGFLKVVEMVGRAGRWDAGLIGQLRTEAHALEALLAGAPERLMLDLMQMRRAEKDFILRGKSKDVLALATAVERLRQDVARAGLAAGRKAELQRHADAYQALFRQYVALQDEIEAGMRAYLADVHVAEPKLELLHANAARAAAATRGTLRGLNVATTWTVAVASLAAIVLGLLIAGLIGRNIDRSVRICMDFAARLAEGDLDKRMPAAGSRNEFGMLTTALNNMAEALQAAQLREQQHTAELDRLNRTLHVLSHCNETLVRATDEPELLTAICRHIVDIGGYRLAWVGYAQHDHGKTVRPVAHAGSEQGYLDLANITWANNERGRGPTGTAIREGRPVATHDIDHDPGFAPWREKARQHGFASSIALPLKGQDGTLGALNIYAGDTGAFNDDEIKLLVELADDLAYGIVSLRETATRKRVEHQLDYQSHYDPLTGLANRSLFIDRLEQLIAHAGRTGHQVAVLLLDLDRFKAINDSLGHAGGDHVLKEVGRRLAAMLRTGDTVARLSADEFGVALGDLELTEDAATIAHKLMAAITQPLPLEGQELFVSASLGISCYPKDNQEAENLLKSAGTAMHKAKSLGGNAFHFYAADMDQRIAASLALEGALRRALDNGELQLYFQPKVSLHNGRMVGAEVLARWPHPEIGMISPVEFIPLAESTGLIVQLGGWVLKQACAQIRLWLDAGLPVLPVAVNLAARQFREENLVQTVREALHASALEPKWLELEITESTAMHNVEETVATMRELKAIGLALHMDDFGTGYSSLTYLKRFPIDYLKIDQSFVREVTTDPDDAAICSAMIGLAHSLKLRVIAEGVETEGQMNTLRLKGCDEIQGYYFSKPLPAEEFARLLAERRTMALPAATDGERQRTLLLVDDEENVLSALKRLLRHDGYHILGARSAAQAFELLALHDVQVVVADQRMPEMSGTEFLNRVKQLHPETVRMVLTGYTDLHSVTDAINLGAIYKFLTKPWEDEELLEQIQEAFRHYQAQTGSRTTPGHGR